MKIKFNEKYTTIAAYALIVSFLSISFYFVAGKLYIFHIDWTKVLNPLKPIWYGLGFAYILNLIMVSVERSKKLNLSQRIKKDSLRRTVSMIITYFFVIVFLYISFMFVLPQLIESVTGLVSNAQDALYTVSDSLDKWFVNLNLSDAARAKVLEKRTELINAILSFGERLIPVAKGFVLDLIESVWNIVLGIIISIYLLYSKEQFMAMFKKLSASILNGKAYGNMLDLMSMSNEIFRKFIGGKILDSLIIGLITYISLIVLKMPYTIIVAFIVCVTNVIPFFGPFIGAIPSFFIILFANPVKALWFVPLIFVIQQLDGNVIGPKILGVKLGTSPFWILFALLIFGKLLGVIGLLIGVPLFVIIYELIKQNTDKRLMKRGLSTKTEDYIRRL